MKELISRKDINGVQLKEGDIIAEGKVGEEIWEGKAIIKTRPLGVVITYREPDLSTQYSPSENNMYNVQRLRKGEVEYTDKADNFLTKGGKIKSGIINISTYDGDFYAWDDIEKIGSIYDLPN